jgi:hypothetical protein
MLSGASSLNVDRTNGGDEVLARAASSRTGSMTPDLFSTAWARVPLLSPNPPPTLRATADAPTASFRRHVLPKDLPAAIKKLDDQELDRLLAAAVAEQRRRGRKPAAPPEPPDKRRIVILLTPGKVNAVRAAFKAGVKPSRIAGSSACPSPMYGRRWRAMPVIRGSWVGTVPP